MSEMYDSLAKLLRRKKSFTVSEAEEQGVSRQQLSLYCRQGRIERLARGLYSPPGLEINPHFDIELLAKKQSNFVVCLLSALRIHNFTTQLPLSLWIAIPHGARLPKLEFATLSCIRLTRKPYEYGIETHDLHGVKVKVYSAAKTVADCFKFRNKVGMDVALEALREGYRLKLFTVSELMDAAKICRITKIITPYVESLFP
jgi:predicted transcriptional regulator of viral defense system